MAYKPHDPRSRLGRDLLKTLGERETPERRSGPRFLAPTLSVLIARQKYQTIDWGLGALVIGDFGGPVKIGGKLKITVTLVNQTDPAYAATTLVLRHDQTKRQLTLQLVEHQSGLLGCLGVLPL